MASGNISVTTDNKYISGKIAWSSTTNIETNQSTVTATLYLSRTNTGYTTSGSGTFYLTINGNTKSNSGSFTITYNSNTVMVSHSVVVDHNADGAKSISISCSGSMPNTSLTATSGSASVTLDTIPRASKISSFANFTIGNSFNISFYCYSTSFSNTLTLTCGGSTVKTINVASGSSGTITQTVSLTQSEYNIILSKFTNGGTSATVSLSLKTLSGSTQIGSVQTANATASITASSITSFNNFNIGADPSISLKIPLPSFSHSLELKVGSVSIKTGTGSANNSNLSLGLSGSTEINALYNQIASNGTSINVTLYVKTMYGATQIGATVSKSVTASATIGNINSFTNFTAGSSFSLGLSSTGQTGLNYILDIKVGSTLITSKTSVSPTTTISLTTEENNTLHRAIPNSTTGSVTAFLTTRYGTKVLGSVSSKVATATITASPSVSNITAVETVSTITSLALGTNRFIQNASKIKFTINGATAGNGATIKSYNINFNSNNYASSSVTIGVVNKTGTLTATATVTDSRNRTATTTVVCTLLAYTIPNITKFTVQRLNSTTLLPDVVLGTTAKWTISASVSSIKDGSGVEKNTISYYVYSKLRESTTYGSAKTSSTPSGLSVSNTTGNLTTYIATSSYDFYLEIKDKINTSSKTIPLSSGQVTMSWSKTGLGIGKIWERGALDVDGDIYSSGLYYGGIGSIRIPANANLNDYTTPGFYYTPLTADARTMLNAPNTIAFSLLVERHAGIKQTFTEYQSSSPRTYVRNLYGSVWGDWMEIPLLSVDGKFGLGTTLPATMLQISNNSSTYSNPANTSTPSIYLYNTNNTSSNANATVCLRTAGSGGGSPFISFDIANVYGWTLGVDVADSVFKISKTWAGFGANALTLDKSSNLTVGGSLTASSKVHTPCIEARSSGGTPYIDFSNDNTVDYDLRFILIDKKTLRFDGGGTLLLSNITDGSLTSVDHAFQIGASSGVNLIADNNEIMVRSNGSASTLYLNNDGGLVSIGNGGLSVGTGGISTTGGLTVGGNLSVNGAVTAGTYSATSGDGDGFRFWNSDSYKIYMSTGGNATWGGRVSGDTNSDYNIYFRMMSGTNRGFVFLNNRDPYFGIHPNGVLSKVDIKATGYRFHASNSYMSNKSTGELNIFINSAGDKFEFTTVGALSWYKASTATWKTIAS